MKRIICFVFHDLVTECNLWEDTKYDTFMEFYKSTQALDMEIIYSFDDGYTSLLRLYENGLVKNFSNFWIFPINNRIGKDGYLKWDEIKFLMSLGCKVGSHTYDHVDMLSLDRISLKKNLAKSKTEFQKKLGLKSVYLSAPYGSTNIFVNKVVSKTGFKGLFSSQPGFLHEKNFQLNRMSLNETTIGPFSKRFLKSQKFAIFFEVFKFNIFYFAKLIFGKNLYIKIRNFHFFKKSF